MADSMQGERPGFTLYLYIAAPPSFEALLPAAPLCKLYGRLHGGFDVWSRRSAVRSLSDRELCGPHVRWHTTSRIIVARGMMMGSFASHAECTVSRYIRPTGTSVCIRLTDRF